jgi:hypothetical protein
MKETTDAREKLNRKTMRVLKRQLNSDSEEDWGEEERWL